MKHTRRLMACLGLACASVLAQPPGLAQHGQSGMDPAVDLLEHMVEEEELDAGSLEDVQSLLDAPIDLNEATILTLERIPILERSAALALIAYRKKNGPFRNWESVHAALDSDVRFIEQLQPFLVLGSRQDGSRHVRRRRKLRAYVATQAYLRSEVERAPSAASASPAEITRRLTTRVHVRDAMGVGGRLTISRGGTQARPQLGGVEATMFEGRVSAVGGAFAAGFGAGLLLLRSGMRDKWQYASGRSPVSGMKVAPRSSVSSDDHLQGGALQIRAPRGVTATALVSRRSAFDGTETLLGASVELPGQRSRAGLLAVASEFSVPVATGSSLHEMRRFTGRRWRAAGIYVDHQAGLHRLAMEVAVAQPGVGAVVAALQTRRKSKASLTLLLRSVSPHFPLLHGRPVALGAADGTGETGILMAASVSREVWRLRLLADAASRPWASSSAAWPGAEYEFRGEVERSWNGVTGVLRLSHRIVPTDLETADDAGRLVRRASFEGRSSLRLQLDAEFDGGLEVRLRLEEVRTQADRKGRSRGNVLYEQIRWRPVRTLRIEVRNVSFTTRSTDARVYVHETDVLYQPMLAVLSGDGFRRYARLRLDLGDHLVLEGKVGRMDRTSVPASKESGGTFMRRVDARVQLRVLW